MTLHWLDLVLVAAIVIAGCGLSYFLLLRTLRRVLAESRRDMERRLAALTTATMMRAAASPGTDALTATEIEAAPVENILPPAEEEKALPPAETENEEAADNE